MWLHLNSASWQRVRRLIRLSSMVRDQTTTLNSTPTSSTVRPLSVMSWPLTSSFFCPSVNHSCDPNVAFDLSSSDPSEWHVRALRRIETGGSVTFFYPSTEWDMDQPFACECRAKVMFIHTLLSGLLRWPKKTCLGSIYGAKYLTLSQLAAQRWISPYILKLVAEREKSL